MHIERLTPTIGAKVAGLDLREVTAADRQMLRAHLEQYLVLFFVGQDLDVSAYRAFADAMGEPEVSPTLATLEGDLNVVQNLESKPDMMRGYFADHWHSDMPYVERPSYATILRPEILPALGGDTLWANMYAAYETLPGAVRRFVDDLEGVNVRNVPGGTPFEAIHPIVRLNPQTGRCGLYATAMFTKGIVGLNANESAKILDLLYAHISSPDFQVRFRWSPDVIAMWDNRFTQHYGVKDYTEPRRMLRITLAGERPVGKRQRNGESVSNAPERV